MAIDSETMRQIISNVFDEMLGLPTCHTDSFGELNEKRYVASIRISGAADETIVVEAPVESARCIAESMFAADPESLESEEVQDAVGEIVNMIGGNVKGTYEGDSALSLPCVSDALSESTWTDGESDACFLTVADKPVLIRWRDNCAVTA